MCHLNKIVTNSHVATNFIATKIAIGFFLCPSSLPLPKLTKKYKHLQNVGIAKAQKNHQHPLLLAIIETHKKSQAHSDFDHHRNS
jgi:hypothetical protein